jgi:hypothetical protein
LLEEDTKAIALCKRLEKDKKLTLHDLVEWPLFEKLRDSAAMASWLAKLKGMAVQKSKKKAPEPKTTRATESIETNRTAKKPLTQPKSIGTRSRSLPAK